jgi:hypothetical protein
MAIRAFLFLFFLNGLLYCGWLNIKLFLTHKTSQKALSHLSDQQQSEFQKIPAGDLDKDESDEVWFKGKLFDVVKRERNNDTEYVYVAPDKDEQDVLDIIFDHFRSDDHLLSENVNKISSSKHISRATNLHYIPVRLQRLIHHNSAVYAFVMYASPGLADASEVLTPPPRKIFLPHTPVL